MWIGRWSAGLTVDEFAPRLSFFFNAHNDFFEEIAKYRAARKIWAEIMRDRYGARDERSLKLRFHAQTAGCSLTWQQPYNNVVRTALQALAAVLGGAQSLHTNSLDEALALPSEHAVTLALRTQQVLAYETGVDSASLTRWAAVYYLEQLTADMEREAPGDHRRDRRDGRHDPGDRGRVSASQDRAGQLRVPAIDRTRGADHRRRQPFPAGTTNRSDPADERRAGTSPGGETGRLRAKRDNGGAAESLSALGAEQPPGTRTQCPIYWMQCAPPPLSARFARRCAVSSACIKKAAFISVATASFYGAANPSAGGEAWSRRA